MIASMERHQAYVRDWALAMAGQHAAYQECLAARAALMAATASMTVPVSRAGLTATPAGCWDLVHHRGMPVGDVARKLGVPRPSVLELLAEHKPVAEAQEARLLQASDAAHMYGGRSPR